MNEANKAKINLFNKSKRSFLMNIKTNNLLLEIRNSINLTFQKANIKFLL